MSSARPRRVLYVEANEDGTVGGSHRCLHDLVRHLDRSRFEPVVVFYQSNPYVERLRAMGVEVHVWEAERARERVAAGRWRRPRIALRLADSVIRRARFLRSARIDLVHGNNMPIPFCEDWLPAARIAACAALAHARAALPAGTSRIWLRLAGRLDRILAISGTVQDSLRQSGIAPARIALVHDGIDLDALRARASADPALVRRGLGVAADEFLVVLVGNVRSWKGQHVLIEALGCVDPALRTRTRALLVGAVDPRDGGYAASLRERCAAQGLDDRVEFLGARDDAPDLMRAADVVVHASTIPEPFGLVVIEGMALGKAVVASRLGGPGETVREGSGLLFDPGRPAELARELERLAADPQLCRELGEQGRRRAESFGILACRDKIQSVYEELR